LLYVQSTGYASLPDNSRIQITSLTFKLPFHW